MSSNAPAHTHKGSPIPLLLLGVFLILLCVYASLLQIQTSEAFILNGPVTGLKPNKDILLQVPQFFQGQLSVTMTKAFMWGFGVEALYLICVIGYEHAHGAVKSSNQTLAKIFVTGMVGCVIFNGWSDFQYGQMATGFWGQFAFAVITSFMVAFFGIVGVKFLEVAMKEWGK
jgi:hypothetical protein